MGSADLKKLWLKNFETVPLSLENVKNIKTAATAFNTNVDAVIKFSGEKLLRLIKEYKLSLNDLSNIKEAKLKEPADAIKGIFKCFSRGIAEEWLTEDTKVYDWLVENIGYDRLQMGGQGGIVANVLGVTGIQKVYAHTNSLPKLQADQFLKLDNIVSFDNSGKSAPAHKIDRNKDIPLIHWIIEFDKGDSFEIEGEKVVCPKSNRFIATYDPLNFNLVKDEAFIKELDKTSIEFIILSGFHALSEDKNGLTLIKETLPLIKNWKKHNKEGVLHLEIASTQDVTIRKSIVNDVAPIADSIGVNEREVIDVLEVIGQEKLAEKCDKDTHSVNLFEGVLAIKSHIKCPRVQLHMFGLYLTVQDKGFKISPKANLNGMKLAATIAAGKAGTGHVNAKENLLWAYGKEVSDVGLDELKNLADYIGDKNLLKTGISSYKGLDIAVVPTILIDKPITLVGMGDTISSVSLIGTR